MLFLITKAYIPGAVVSVICIINIMRCMKWRKKVMGRITDISKSKIHLDQNTFSCFQAAENNTYESCTIALNEIKQIVENTTIGEIGFFIYLKKDAFQSSIFVNEQSTERNIFYVNGFGYEIEEFREVFHKLLHSMPNVVKNVTEYQSSWYQMSEQEIWRKLISAWIFVGIVIVIKFFAAFSGITIPFV